MSWIVFAFGFVVIALAVAVALGRFGEMQAKPVLDAARGRIPDGPVDAQFLSALMLPTRGSGYSTPQVDGYLVAVVAGTAGPVDQARFDVRSGGYDMAVVDEILERVKLQQAAVSAPADPAVPDWLFGDGQQPASPARAAEPGAAPQTTPLGDELFTADANARADAPERSAQSSAEDVPRRSDG